MARKTGLTMESPLRSIVLLDQDINHDVVSHFPSTLHSALPPPLLTPFLIPHRCVPVARINKTQVHLHLYYAKSDQL